MCTMAAIWVKIRRIVYCSGRDDVHRTYFESVVNALDFVTDVYRSNVTMEGGVLHDACAALHYRPRDEISTAEQSNCWRSRTPHRSGSM